MKPPREVRIENQSKTWFVLYLKPAPNRPVAARFPEKQLLVGDGWTRREVVEWVSNNKKLKLVEENFEAPISRGPKAGRTTAVPSRKKKAIV